MPGFITVSLEAGAEPRKYRINVDQIVAYEALVGGLTSLTVNGLPRSLHVQETVEKLDISIRAVGYTVFNHS